MKKLIQLAVILFSLPLIQGCKSYHYDHGHDHDDHGGWHDGDHGGHGGGHDDHGGHGGHHSVAEVSSADLLAQDSGISSDSAQKIINFAEASDKMKAVEEMGVDAKDMAPLANLEMPSQDSIARISAALGEDSTKVEQVLASFISDIKSESK